ncbi:MAG TPA: hypothetical protein VFT41_09820 [Gemmatimonadaceae bacterium]|nr:hypothetical protein [Gemmatimonadaceae bacterium]
MCAAAALAGAAGCSSATGIDSGAPPDSTHTTFDIQATPAVWDFAVRGATDGAGTFLIATWRGDSTITHGNAGAQLVSASGNVLGSGFTFGANAGDVPIAGFDGTHYLLVFQQGTLPDASDVFGQVIDRSGSTVGAPFQISASNGMAVWGVQFGAGTYLVTYTSAQPGTFARTVSPNGALGPEVTIAPGGDLSAVAFDGRNFLVEYATDAELHARFVSPAGAPGQDVTLASGYDADVHMDVGFNGTNYLLAWGQSSFGTGWVSSIRVRAVTPGGTRIGSETTIPIAPPGGDVQKMIVSGSDFVLEWREKNPAGGATTKVQFFDGNGVPLSSPQTVASTDAQYHVYFAWVLPAGGSRYLEVINRAPLDSGQTDVVGKFVTLTP